MKERSWEKPSNWTLHGAAPEVQSQVPLWRGGSTCSPVHLPKVGMPSVFLPIPPEMQAPACRPSPANKKEISLKANAVCRAAPPLTPFSYHAGLLAPSSLEPSFRIEYWLYLCTATGP